MWGSMLLQSRFQLSCCKMTLAEMTWFLQWREPQYDDTLPEMTWCLQPSCDENLSMMIPSSSETMPSCDENLSRIPSSGETLPSIPSAFVWSESVGMFKAHRRTIQHKHINQVDDDRTANDRLCWKRGANDIDAPVPSWCKSCTWRSSTNSSGSRTGAALGPSPSWTHVRSTSICSRPNPGCPLCTPWSTSLEEFNATMRTLIIMLWCEP